MINAPYVKRGRKFRYIKPFAMLLAAVLLCGMAGCSKNGTSAPESSADSAIGGEVSTVSGESSEVSGDSDSAKIKPEITLDGQLITLPCNVKDVDGITIDREYSFVVVPASENVDEYSTAYFYYNNVRAGQVLLDGNCSDMSDLGDATLIGIRLNDDRIPMSYMGLTYNSNRDNIISVLGNPGRSGDIAMNYDLGTDGSVLIGLGSKDTITSVAIFLYIR